VLKTCALTACGKLFETRTKRIYCTPTCSKIRQQEQLKELGERRKREATAHRIDSSTCTIETCRELFQPKNGRQQKYCGYRCAQVGLQRAIERQKLRREAAKQAKQTPAQSPQ
jgi:hypothetical protein